MFKYAVELKSGKYLSAPPVEGKRLRCTVSFKKAYNFGSRNAGNVARGFAGAQVASGLND